MARRHQLLTSKSTKRKYPMSLINFVSVSVLLAALEWGLIPQTKQGFYCNDPTLSFPYRGDTISISTLLVVSVFGPLFVIILIEALREEYFSQIRCRNVWQWYKEYLIVFCIVLLVTEVAKVLFGEHRPHFLLSCVPDTASTCQDGSFVYEFECTNTNAEATRYFLTDTSRSFPSGHSSVSVFAALYSAVSISLNQTKECSLLKQQNAFQAVVHWRMPTRHTGQLLKPLLVTICLLWGVVSSLTRITDRRHHWWDVLAGTILGSVGAFYALFVLRQNTLLEKSPRISPSTVTLLDERNKDAASVAI